MINSVGVVFFGTKTPTYFVYLHVGVFLLSSFSCTTLSSISLLYMIRKKNWKKVMMYW